ncbi:MAG: hypothetical protein KGR98_03555, partial [Verrucomicrobia bacterium]|nr:hypothetical protein [Verrucomicrobiota bacterium]
MNLAAQNNNPHAPDCARNAFLRRRAPAIGLLIVAVVFFGLAALTWRKWPDIIVDFGAQLYIPWRLSRGAVLYRDLFY